MVFREISVQGNAHIHAGRFIHVGIPFGLHKANLPFLSLDF